MNQEEIKIAGTLVVVATGRDTQTVNVCASGNVRGDYDPKYVSDNSSFWVKAHELERLFTLQALDEEMTRRQYKKTRSR